MLATQHSRPGSGDIWRRHAPEIQNMYRDNTVEIVKRFMEDKRGFPEMAVPTWNEKLGKLGMRKNVTSEEWKKIYLHCLPRLEDPTRKKGDLKLKRTKQETEIIVRGRRYSWDQAWKNMKSAKAIGQILKNGESAGPLPPDIVIRSPRATPRETLPLSPSVLPILQISLERRRERGSGSINTQGTGLPPHGHVSSHRAKTDHRSSDAVDTPLDIRMILPMEEYSQVVRKLCMTGLPIYYVVRYIVEIANFAAPSGTALQNLLPCFNQRVSSTNVPFKFQPRENLTHRFLSAVFMCPSNDLSTFTSPKNYILLLTLIYMISNSLTNGTRHENLFRNLNPVFAAVPPKHLEALLHRSLNSTRAAFDAFLHLSGRYNQRDAFQFLVNFGATYSWLASSAKGHLFLLHAVSMNLVSTLQTLLDNGCRPDFSIPPIDSVPTAIVKALTCGDMQCAQLLMEHCDVNKPVTSGFTSTNFECFLKELGSIGKLSEAGLRLFLQAGADLERPINGPMENFSEPRDWMLSAADYLFYFHRPLFHLLPSELAQVHDGRLSRVGTLLSLEDGTQRLETYLDTLVPCFDQKELSMFFHRLIAEQFIMCDLHHRKRDTDLETVRVLLSFTFRFGTSIDKLLGSFHCILDSFVDLVGDDCDGRQIEAALYLVGNGATVTGKVLSWMARLSDARPLDLALSSAKNPRGLELAFTHAAARNNFGSIERLLQAGARLDKDIPRVGWDRRDRVSIVARVMLNHKQRGLSQMLDFLILRGAPLRLSKKKPHLHHLLQLTLDNWGWLQAAETMERVQYIVGAGYNLWCSPFPTAPLLESSGCLQVFEYLYHHGAQLRPGSPLAVWINMGGGIHACREMLVADADPNAYTRYDRTPFHGLRRRRTPLQMAAWTCNIEIMELLLLAGSEINAPAKGYNGFTALQASCRVRTYTLQDQERKLAAIRYLLAHGADVNAAPARKKGKTALQEAATSGDLAVAKLLLFHNPMADVNAPPYTCEFSSTAGTGFGHQKPRFGTALDCAAEKGRIDMVKLLLNCNALSHYRGKTGYDGAIKEARSRGHIAVADLICQHAEDAKRSDTSPRLSQPMKNYHGLGYKLDRDDSSEQSKAEDTSASLSDTDQMDPSKDFWEGNAVGCVCSDIHQADRSTGYHVHDANRLTQSFAHLRSPTPMANSNNTWPDERGLDPSEDGHIT